MVSVVQRVTLQRSRRKYATFWNCLMQVDMVLADARTVAAKMDDSGTLPWWMASPSDLRKCAKRVEDALGTLSKSAKKWEAELISRDWRK